MVDAAWLQYEFIKGAAMKNKYIKIKINAIPKDYGKTALTDKEKEARIIALAEKMNIKIGGKK